MNIAQRSKEYYEHEDFKDNYAMYLFEDSHAIKDNIKQALGTYEFEKYYGFEIPYNQRNNDYFIDLIYDYILENWEDFLKDFRSYWVGSTSIASISFGEQEEQLTGIYNHRTGKDYTLPYLKRVYDQEGFYVSGNYAYYDLSDSGLHIDLLTKDIPIIKSLNMIL